MGGTGNAKGTRVRRETRLDRILSGWYQLVPKSRTGGWGRGCKLTASAGAPFSLDALAGAATPVGVPAQHPRWKRHTTTPALSPWAATKQRPLWLVFTRRAAPSGVSGLMAPRADRPVVLYQ